jgi:hypothetical protein
VLASTNPLVGVLHMIGARAGHLGNGLPEHDRGGNRRGHHFA